MVGSPGLIRRAALEGPSGLALPRTTAWRSDDPAVFLDAVIALDDTTLVAMGDPLSGCLTVLRSGDGGRSWATVPCAVMDGPGVPASREGEAAFAASNGNLSAVGDTVWMLSGGGASRVYRSVDRGQSWAAFYTPLQQGGQMTGGFSMDFADAQHGIVWGGNWEAKDDNTARAAVTADGGETWALLADSAGPGYGSSVRVRPGSKGRQLRPRGHPRRPRCQRRWRRHLAARERQRLLCGAVQPLRRNAVAVRKWAAGAHRRPGPGLVNRFRAACAPPNV